MALRQMTSNVNMRPMYNKSAVDSMGSFPYPMEGFPIGLLLDNFKKSSCFFNERRVDSTNILLEAKAVTLVKM